ncbi:hypothetical protein P7K49_040254 [Saguinus oedipus]|uniref:SFR19-like C-terminal domain-containing protein n=1 Tax=Saguinus oedipus TaxID=9490 RepID=A0ABQ9T8T0_SAGOE|nr:hypothetical protein P7K49_040254 [Saguinus oedipus]
MSSMTHMPPLVRGMTRYMKKLQVQERAVEEVKLAIKPFYQKREVTKEEYKDILRKAVQKVGSARVSYWSSGSRAVHACPVGALGPGQCTRVLWELWVPGSARVSCGSSGSRAVRCCLIDTDFGVKP